MNKLAKFLTRCVAPVALLSTLVAAPAQAAGTLLGQTPAANAILTIGSLEWVYAGPCAGEAPTCGAVVLHDGFRFASDEEWTASFSSRNELISLFAPTNVVCAAKYFSNYGDNCDYGDLNVGAIWHAPLTIASATFVNHPAAETFLVRGSLGNAVPEPESIALVGLALAGVGLARRRSNAAQQ